VGYRKARTLYKLSFEDHIGLEVSAGSVPTQVFLGIISAKEASDTPVMFEAFAKALHSWNLEDEDGTPVPPTLEGLYAQDFSFVLEIIGAWIEAVGGVSTPLATPSSAGAPPPELQLPMEPLSLSRAN
jgi:hypothetical protein